MFFFSKNNLLPNNRETVDSSREIAAISTRLSYSMEEQESWFILVARRKYQGDGSCKLNDATFQEGCSAYFVTKDSPRDAALYLTMLDTYVCVCVYVQFLLFSLSLFLEEEEESNDNLQ